MKRPTFFTRDRDFRRPALRHRAFGLVFVDVVEREGEVADAIRRFLRHGGFRHFAQRAGKVVRLHADAISYWAVGTSGLHTVSWRQPDCQPGKAPIGF